VKVAECAHFIEDIICSMVFWPKLLNTLVIIYKVLDGLIAELVTKRL